ncbi:MAG: DNA-processing protein DprA [Bacteroidota bacterium]
MLDQNKLYYQIALSFIPNVGDIIAKSLLSYCGSAEKIFSTPKSKLLKIPDIGEKTANDILNKTFFNRVDLEIEFINKYQIQTLFFTDAFYPQRLKECIDSPILLYYKGNADLNQEKIISIVGTRNATDYGKGFIKKLCEDLTHENILILSGLAYGIDTYAHRFALENNIQNIGVLGHGMQTIYPAQNKALAKQMLSHGGLLTEFASQHTLLPSNFPRRNRIVAGMCDAIIVVESAMKGGALITANIANSYNKDVMALPGNYNSKFSMGCNFLLKTHKATIIENATDLLKLMAWSTPKKKPMAQKELFLELNKLEFKIVSQLKEFEIIDIDYFIKLQLATPGELATCLLELEFKGIVFSLPGKRYKLA